jgi:hypothetical protein
VKVPHRFLQWYEVIWDLLLRKSGQVSLDAIEPHCDVTKLSSNFLGTNGIHITM